MTTWTEERVATVTRLWNEGLTTAEIGRMVGMSKNAVVGKAHRLRLPSRPSPIGQGKGIRSVRPPAGPKPAPPPRPVLQLAVGTASCKWPIGHPDEPDFHFCGEPALLDKPYCQAHYAKAYVPAKPRSDAA